MVRKENNINHGNVVVTGASRGIGEACVLALLRAGFKVFAGIRRIEDSDALMQKTGGAVNAIMLDVTCNKSIASAVEQVSGSVGEKGIAGLVNNAGIAVAGPIELLPIEELRRQFEVNVIGQMAVTQAFLPLLRQGKGRIVNMGSKEGKMAMPFVGPYCASKFAMEAFTDSLRMELKPWGIHVSIIEPGVIATTILQDSISTAEKNVRNAPVATRCLYDRAIAAGLKTADMIVKAAIPVEMVAKSIVHALTTRVPRTRYTVGFDARVVSILCRIMPDRALDWIMLRSMGIQGMRAQGIPGV